MYSYSYWIDPHSISPVCSHVHMYMYLELHPLLYINSCLFNVTSYVYVLARPQMDLNLTFDPKVSSTYNAVWWIYLCVGSIVLYCTVR